MDGRDNTARALVAGLALGIVVGFIQPAFAEYITSSGGAATVSVSAPITGDGSSGSPLTCASASAVASGCVDTTNQTFAGNKTFSGIIQASASGVYFTNSAYKVYASGGLVLDSNVGAEPIYTRATVVSPWSNGATNIGSGANAYGDAFLLGNLTQTASTSGAGNSAASTPFTIEDDEGLTVRNGADSAAAPLTASTITGSAFVGNRSLLASVFVGGVTAATNYGGDVLPAQAFTVAQAAFRIATAGSGGTSNFTFRITDGTNTCDCAIACNTAAGNVSPTCSGAAGAGCALPASASLTYSVNSIGDCTVGPEIVGNVQVRGTWQ